MRKKTEMVCYIKNRLMKSEIKVMFFLVGMLFITACTFDFSEDYFKEIPTNKSNGNIKLSGFINGEKTSSSKMIQYVISGTGYNDFEMIVKVDEVEIYRSQERKGEFNFFVDNLVDGEHKLIIEYAFHTGSGSLADAVGREIFVDTATYNFTLDKTLSNPFGIKSVSIVGGSIYIDLNPITDNNFEKAFLLIKNEYGFIVEERPISQVDLSDLQIQDDKTIMYNPSYAIKVKNAFAEKISEFVLLPTSKLNFTLEPIQYDSYKLRYNGHPFYGNFDAIGMEYFNYLVGNSYHTLLPQGGESIISNKFYFGTTNSIKIKIIKNNSVIGEIIEQLQLGENLPVSQFEEITYISSLNKYFIIDVSKTNELIIYQLNGQTFEIENLKKLATLDFSGDFNSLEVDPISNALIINMNKRALVFNPLTFSVIGNYNAVDYNNNRANADVYYRGKYVILEDSALSGEVLIYEIASGLQKFSINKTTKFFSAVDASFFYANRGLYKLQAGNFVFVKTIQDTQNNTGAPALEHITFDKLSNSAVFGWYQNTYYLDLSNYKQTYIWDTAIVYDVKYTDQGRPFINSNHFSAGNKSHIYDVNLNKTKLIDTFSQQSYRYFNGYIFSPNGFYLKSNLFAK